VTPADAGERDALRELLPEISGPVIGDKGCTDGFLKNELPQSGIGLQTPFRSNMKNERDPRFARTPVSVRRRAETVIGQLCERFNIEKVRAGDLRHLRIKSCTWRYNEE
jgi:hypothetical protein